MKAHVALSLALRADNHSRFARNCNRDQTELQTLLKEEDLFYVRPGYLAKWIELHFPATVNTYNRDPYRSEVELLNRI